MKTNKLAREGVLDNNHIFWHWLHDISIDEVIIPVDRNWIKMIKNSQLFIFFDYFVLLAHKMTFSSYFPTIYLNINLILKNRKSKTVAILDICICYHGNSR